MMQQRCDADLSIVHSNVYRKEGVAKGNARASSPPTTVIESTVAAPSQ